MVTKINRIKSFLADNHAVKVSCMEKKPELRKNPNSVHELTGKLLLILQEIPDVSIVKQRTVVAERQDIMITPKKPHANITGIPAGTDVGSAMHKRDRQFSNHNNNQHHVQQQQHSRGHNNSQSNSSVSSDRKL